MADNEYVYKNPDTDVLHKLDELIDAVGGGGGSATLIDKSITADGTYKASDDNADGYKKVVVNVSPNVGTKSITENGTYTASSDELDGYSSVTVNVTSGIIESWIINSKTSISIPTTTTHISYTNDIISSFDVCQNAGDHTITMGDLQTFIGNSSDFYWQVTALDDMTYKIHDVLNNTYSELLTASNGDVIIDDGTIDEPYCMEIIRYS